MNLILQDVEEHYTVRLRVERTKLIHVTDIGDIPEEKLVPGTQKCGKVEC